MEVMEVPVYVQALLLFTLSWSSCLAMGMYNRCVVVYKHFCSFHRLIFSQNLISFVFHRKALFLVKFCAIGLPVYRQQIRLLIMAWPKYSIICFLTPACLRKRDSMVCMTLLIKVLSRRNPKPWNLKCLIFNYRNCHFNINHYKGLIVTLINFCSIWPRSLKQTGEPNNRWIVRKQETCLIPSFIFRVWKKTSVAQGHWWQRSHS